MSQLNVRLLDDLDAMLAQVRSEFGTDPTDERLREANSCGFRMTSFGLQTLFRLIDMGLPDSRIVQLLHFKEELIALHRSAYLWSKANPLSAKKESSAVLQFVPTAARSFRLNGPVECRQPPGKAGSPSLVASSAAP